MRILLSVLTLTLSTLTYKTAFADEATANPPKLMAVGVKEAPYSYEERSQLVQSLKEHVSFFEAAIRNWQEGLEKSDTREELKTYCKQSIDSIAPKLAKFQGAINKVSSASQDAWLQIQTEAKAALKDARTAYLNLHRPSNSDK